MKLKRALTIGRDASCDLRLDQDTVSRRHASLRVDGDGRYRLEDLGSSNGTWRRAGARWERIGSTALEDDDLLRFGEVETTLRGLLQRVPAVLMTGEPTPGDTPLLVAAEAPGGAPLDRPRRNPDTGEIEESP